MPNTSRNNILLLLGSLILEFKLHNIEGYWWHLAVPVEVHSRLFEKKYFFFLFWCLHPECWFSLDYISFILKYV